MKIKNIKIQNDLKTQELFLSTDNQKNVNLVIGQNDSGKTRTFNEIKSYFQNNQTNSKTEIILSDLIDSPNIDLMFVDEKYVYDIQKLLDLKEFSEEERYEIAQKTNQLLSTIGGIFMDAKIIIDKKYKIMILNQYGIDTANTLAAGPKIILYFALLIAIREIIEPNLPLIIDVALGRLDNEFQLKTLEMLTKNIPQLLIFTTDSEFQNKSSCDENNITSPYIFLEKNGNLGSVYLLKNNTFEKYG